MRVAVLSLSFSLPGCRSLKEKRGRVSGLRDRFGKSTQIAACESGEANTIDQAEWSFVVAAANARLADQIISGIERDVESRIDGFVTDMQREWLI